MIFFIYQYHALQLHCLCTHGATLLVASNDSAEPSKTSVSECLFPYHFQRACWVVQVVRAHEAGMLYEKPVAGTAGARADGGDTALLPRAKMEYLSHSGREAVHPNPVAAACLVCCHCIALAG